MQLPKRLLGKTDIQVSVIGLGTVKLGRNKGVKYPQSFELPSDGEASDLLACAKDLGINLLDTAPAYGTSETRLGNLISSRRQEWVICTKVGEEFSDGKSNFDFSPQHAKFSVERSLQRLRTDYLDIVLVHSDGNDRDIIENSGVLDTLADLKKDGKIRAFGMSTKTVEGGLLAARECDCVMVTWNEEHQAEIPVIDACRNLNTGVLIKKVFASGHRADASRDPIREALTPALLHTGVTSVVIGTINQRHLKTNAEIAGEILDNN